MYCKIDFFFDFPMYTLDTCYGQWIIHELFVVDKINNNSNNSWTNVLD